MQTTTKHLFLNNSISILKYKISMVCFSSLGRTVFIYYLHCLVCFKCYVIWQNRFSSSTLNFVRLKILSSYCDLNLIVHLSLQSKQRPSCVFCFVSCIVSSLSLCLLYPYGTLQRTVWSGLCWQVNSAGKFIC